MRTIADEASVAALVEALTGGDARAASFGAAGLVASGRARLVLEACLLVAHLAHPSYAGALLEMASSFRPRTSSHSADLVATSLAAVRGAREPMSSDDVPVEEAIARCSDEAGRRLLGGLPSKVTARWKGMVRLCVTAAVSGVEPLPAVCNDDLRALLEDHRTGRVLLGGERPSGGGIHVSGGDASDLKLCALWTHAGVAPEQKRRVQPEEEALAKKVVSCSGSDAAAAAGAGRGVVVIAVPRG